MGPREARTRRLDGLRLWAPEASTPTEVVQRLVAVQGQEHPYALWSVAQRIEHDSRPTAAEMAVAYDLGDVLRTHVMRPTWHLVAPADARWLLTLTNGRVRRFNAPIFTRENIDDALISRAIDLFAREVDRGRHRTRDQLRSALSDAGIHLSSLGFTCVLMAAELERVLISGASDGKQRTHAAFDERVPPGFVGGASSFDRESALAELAERYVATRGPASVADLAAWSGLTIGDGRRGIALALERAPGSLEPVELDGQECWLAPAELPRAPRSPRVDLVQAFDEYVMSYSRTRAHIFPDGFTPPTAPTTNMHWMLADGVISGSWKHERRSSDARLQLRAITPLDDATAAALRVAAADYSRYLGLPIELVLQ